MIQNKIKNRIETDREISPIAATCASASFNDKEAMSRHVNIDIVLLN